MGCLPPSAAVSASELSLRSQLSRAAILDPSNAASRLGIPGAFYVSRVDTLMGGGVSFNIETSEY